MAVSTIQRRQFGPVETKTFPFTADKDGIVVAIITPPSSTTSYVYITESGSAHFRGASTGLQYTLVFPVRKGKTYAIGTSANYSINSGVRLYPL